MTPEETGRWIFAIAKHIKVYAQGPQIAYLYAISRSAKDGELLLRLRQLGTVRLSKVEAIALDIGIPRQELLSSLERLEATGLISILRRSTPSEIIGIHETIFTEAEVYRATAKLFDEANPYASERAIIPLIDLMSKLPLTEEEATSRTAQQGFSEQDINMALELQEAFGLLRKQHVSDFGVTLLHNEYLWGHKIERVGPIIAKLQTRETDHLIALMDEVRSVQGLSIDRLTAAPQHIVALAANTGILDTTTILTATGDEKTFAFSPHFYGYKAGTQPALLTDPADQVRLFVASISYGVHHSIDFRLHSPQVFVEKLLRDGEAGNATPILRDYVLLEKQGIVSVEQRNRGRGTFVLHKKDIVEKALDVMINGSLLNSSGQGEDARSLVSQRDYRSPEENRLTGDFGRKAGDTKQFNNDLLAAVREAAQRGNW